jgi:soluble lytic murein transglycosylase-like protein
MSAYVDFCQEHDMSPWHPRSWTPQQDAYYAAWKLANFKAKWAFFKAQRIASWMPAEMIRERVRHSVQALRAPAPSRPWKVCPCHAPAWDRWTREPVTHGLDFIRSFRA